MRLLIVGTLGGQLTTATKLAMDKGANVTHAESNEQALAVLRSGRGADLLMVDVMLDIRDLVARLDAERIHVPIVACGVTNDARAAVNAIHAGAKEFIPLPPDPDLIAAVLAAVTDDTREMIYRDDSMAKVVKLAQQIAGSDASVLITGESGTGKEVLARFVHSRSTRAKKPFITVNCAAKLLRAIQERVIDRVGGGKPVPVDIRIIATSNRNLTDAVREGKFREDLLFRLNVVNLKIPPLRERPADISELAQHFIKKYSLINGLALRPLSGDARRALNSNRWPGNVRELENTLHRAVLLSTGAEIGVDGILSPDGARLDQARGTDLAAHAALAAEQVTRNLVGRTVAEVERDLILETLKHCLGNRTHAANILGISIRTLRNKLNEYAADGAPIPPPHGGSELRGAA
jgi:two-component system response regulator FlrC